MAKARAAKAQPAKVKAKAKPKATPTPKPEAPAKPLSANPRRAPTLAELFAAIGRAADAKQHDELVRVTGRAATRTKTVGERRELQQVLQASGNRALWAQRWVDAAAIYDVGVTVWRPGEDSQVTAELYAEGGFAMIQLHRLDEAEARIRRALALHEEASRAQGAATAVYYLSSVLFERGQIDRAVELGREALQRSIAADDNRGATFHAYSLARGLYEQGHSREAEEVSQAALEQARTLGLTAVEGNFENMIANVALDDHRLADARRHYERARALFRQANLQTHLAITTSNLGNLAWDEDRLDDALVLYAEAIKLQKGGKNRRATAIALTARAGVLTELGRFAQAQGDLETALATMTEEGHERRVSFVRAAFARLAEARGEPSEACAHYAEAEISLEAVGDTVEIGRMLYAAAGARAEAGDPASAEALVARAAALDPASLDPASLSPDQPDVGERRAGMHAVRALRELALARIEVARSRRLEGDAASALRRAATARMQGVRSGSLMGSSAEVRRVALRLAAQLAADAPVRAARRFAGTSHSTGWDTELTGELWLAVAGRELVATGSLAWDDRTARLEARGPEVPGLRHLRGTLLTAGPPAASWAIRLEVEPHDKLLRGRIFEILEEGGEDEICELAWRPAVTS